MKSIFASERDIVMRSGDRIRLWIDSKKDPPRFLRISLILTIIAGSFFIAYTYMHYIDRSKTAAINLARAFESFITPEIIGHLDAAPSDIEKPEYIKLKRELTKFAKLNDDIRFAYLFVQKNDQVYFLADSEPPESQAYSPPGQEYTGFSIQDFNHLKEGQIIITPLARDKWGTWVSVTVPIVNHQTREVIAAFGIDYPAATWYSEPIKNTGYSAIFVIGLIFIFIAYYRQILYNESLRQERDKLEIMTHKLSASELLFRRVFEKAPIGIAILNNFRFISTINQEFEEITGRTRSELAAIDWTEMTHPDDLQEDLHLFEQFNAGVIDGYEMNKRFIKPDGSLVWVKMIIAPLTVSASGLVDEHLCLIEDVTEKIKVRVELEESERSKNVLLLHLPGIAYRCKYNQDWTMEFVSEGCYELTGYRAVSFINNRDLSYNDVIAPEYRDRIWQQWAQVVENRSVFRSEYPIITKSGEIKWVYEQGQPVFDLLGNVQALEGLIIDISDRKKKEEEILYINYHDYLTGLYNRRFFEEEKLRLDNHDNLPLSVIFGDINGLKLINDAFGHEAGDKLIKNAASILSKCCRERDILFRTGGDEFVILMPRTNRQEALLMFHTIQQAFIRESHKRENYYMSLSLGFNTKEVPAEDIKKVIKIAEDNMYKHKLLEHKSSHSAIISMIKTTMFNFSNETEAHANRLSELARKIGLKLELSRTEMDELELLATLHDIGKLGIDGHILNKTEPLNEAEWAEMKKHTEIGFRIAMSTQELAPIAYYILSHHERWDGSGYPNGLKGEQIPLLSRILSVIDAYDAMTSKRIYSVAKSREEACDELKKNAGSQFDPHIVDIFLSE
jgi:diguanylate cyclase (GGDEF)-like protein/PAS domain S-box-containing protein